MSISVLNRRKESKKAEHDEQFQIEFFAVFFITFTNTVFGRIANTDKEVILL